MKRLLSVFLCLLTASLLSAGAIPDMKFRRLDTRDGLSNSQINCILRDSRGFVWIGTPYGLNRYDGYRIKTYYSNVKDTTTMKNNYVDEVFEAWDGRLWIKQSMNYSVFDPVTERFDRQPEAWLHKVGIKGGVEFLYIDSHKNFWVKTYDTGMWFYNPRTKHTHCFHFGYGEQEFNSDIGVSCFAERGREVMIISNNGEIVSMDGEGGRILWKSTYLRQYGQMANQSYKLVSDPKGNLWVTTNGHSFAYLKQEKKWYGSITEVMAHWGIADVPDQISVWDVDTDNSGRLWIATDHGGLYVVDAKHREMRQFLNDKNDETTISDNTLRHIYKDALGRIWIGSYKNGLNLYTDDLQDFSYVELGDINTICEDRWGNYWLGTNDRGIICYNPHTGEQTLYNKETYGFGSNVMVGSLAASDGSLWFGTYEGGLIRYRNGQFTNYRATGNPQDISNNNIWTIAEDSFHDIWVGTLGSGVQRIDGRTGRLYEPINSQNSQLSSDYVSSVQLTSKGWLLVAHSNFYSMVNPKTRRVVNRSIEDNQDNVGVTLASVQVIQDSRGLVWQGSASGLTIVDRTAGRVYLLDMKSGLLGSSITGVAEDKRHTIWASTDHGVSNIVPQRAADGSWTFLVRSYNQRDGLQPGTYNQRAVFCTHDGLILVGGQTGIDIINPNRQGSGRKGETTIFIGLNLFDTEISAGETYNGRVILTEALDHCRKLRLRYAENQFTIQLGSNSGEVSNRSRFVYKLKGFSDQWIRTEEVNPNITYMSLPSGSYTLCVRMLNDDGTIGDIESQLDITIAAPWYRSWWMWLVYIGIALLALRYYRRRQQERMRLARLKMEQESNHRLDELKQHFYDTVSDELREPFQHTFESLNTMMQEENDEQRYEREQQVFGNVEHLLEQVNKLAESGGTAKAKLTPQITEMEITSLDQKLVNDATEYVETNLSNSDISVETMAEALGMSRVHLYKKLTAITDLTPSEFIRQIRLRHAEQLLRKSQLTVAEVSYKVGFNNPRYFSKYFKEMYGVMPSEYKSGGGQPIVIQAE
ncbi:MAG: helix-turn-helix domain-containing protein [Prevotella sp.]|nr:helix-turn-helix domain-containing protein [Prevotella sp.]